MSPPVAHRGHCRQLADRDESGMTLVEVVVVGVLATIVMLALTGFYISSQGTWVDSAAQALTQREATQILTSVADNVHASAGRSVDTSTKTLVLFDHLGFERCRFWLDPADSLIHVGTGDPTVDQGPMARSVAVAFDLWADANMVRVTALSLRSASGRIVTLSTGAAFLNK